MISGEWHVGMHIKYSRNGIYEYTIKQIITQNERDCIAKYYDHIMGKEYRNAIFTKSDYTLIKPAKITDVSQMVF